MESLQQEQPTMENQDKIQENQQKPTSLNQAKSGIQVSKSEDHHHHHLQQQKQSQHHPQQQQQLKRPNESKNEEKMQTLNTQEFKNEEEEEEEKKEKKSDENGENNGGNMGPRERLKRHRREVAGQVWIPEMWGQEDFLKDWIDCSAFDAALMPQGLMLARASLMQQGRRSNSNSLRLENTSC